MERLAVLMEKIILMIVGSIITYYMGLRMLREMGIEYDAERVEKAVEPTDYTTYLNKNVPSWAPLCSPVNSTYASIPS